MNIHSIGPASIGGIPEEKIPALGELPKELPPPGNSLTSTDVSRLFLPEGTDVSRVHSRHPLSELLRGLWLKITVRAIDAGRKNDLSHQ